MNYPATITLVFASTIVIWVLWFFSRRHDRTLWGWVPFSLWGSWLGIETITDIARAVSYYLSKDGSLSAFGQMISTIILALLLLAVACAMRWYMGDWVFGLCVLCIRARSGDSNHGHFEDHRGDCHHRREHRRRTHVSAMASSDRKAQFRGRALLGTCGCGG